jgi:putative ABC transport system permease protein
MSAPNALLRMARRQVVRNKLRSLLIVALIAVPVAAVTMAAVLYRSAPLSTRQQVEKQLGAADARLTWYGDGRPLTQTPDGVTTDGWADPGAGTGPAPADLGTLLPGATVVPEWHDEALVKTPAGAAWAELTGVDLTNPKLRPAVRLVSGAWSAGPDEAVLGADLARLSGVAVGDTVTLRRPAATLTVVGIVSYPYQNLARYLAVSPATYATLGAHQDASSWLVARNAPVTWSDVRALNQHGVLVYSRAVQFHPPPKSEVPVSPFGSTGVPKKAAVTVAVAVGMAVLQLALLAGPAFAVSARRRQRELALIAATGGDRSVLRRTLLAESLVLGVLGAVLGSLLGNACAVLFRMLDDRVTGPLRLRPVELSGIAVLGLLAALVGALLPAHWASRLDVVAALAGRRGTTHRPWRVSVLGLGCLGVGMLAGLVGAGRAEVLLILPGLALCELGVLALTPGILNLAGLLAPRLPVALRIALRDASRNRTAAVPALAAVLAATTASVAIAVFAASYAAKERLQYVPQLPRNVALVSLPADNPYAAEAAVRDLTRYLSTSRVDVLGGNQCPNASCSYATIERPVANQCDPNRMRPTDPRCTGGELYAIGGLDQLVLTADQLGAVAGTVSPADRQALQAGRVLLRSALDLSGPGQVTITRSSGGEPAESTTEVLPAAVLSDPGDLRFTAVFSPATANRLGFSVQPTSVLARLHAPPTASQLEALTGALADYELGAEIEHGYVDRYHTPVLAALIAAVVIAMGATALATALAVVDSRPDLATLWAVGAGPGVRRRLSVARSAVVAVIGVLLGTGLGFLPPWIVIDDQRRRAEAAARVTSGFPVPHPFAVPWWPNLLGIVILIPLAAMLIAASMTGGRPARPLPG